MCRQAMDLPEFQTPQLSVWSGGAWVTGLGMRLHTALSMSPGQGRGTCLHSRVQAKT